MNINTIYNVYIYANFVLKKHVLLLLLLLLSVLKTVVLINIFVEIAIHFQDSLINWKFIKRN